ncbi:MAG TPA: YIP1 family protein [Aggregatilineales bacterium]|nr:YIP1 family protein [Aggregatilineales bacterium]
MPNEGQKTPTRKTTRRQKPTASRRVIQRGLVAQISTALFQPMTFFETLPPMRQTRQWLWVGFVILAMIGLSAVQQATAQPATTEGITDIPITDPFGGGGGDVIISPDLGGGIDFGTPPIDPNAPATGADPAQTVNNWTIALVAASQLVLMWAILSVMLIVVPMFKGNPPQLGENVQVAIYASLPLGVMAVLQLVFMAAGGTLGAAGLSGLVDEMPLYTTGDPFLRSLILSAASQTTLFMLWSLLMVYFGGRAVLGGQRLVITLVVFAWIALLIITPVVTGAIQSEPVDVISEEMNFDFSDGMEMPPPDVEGLMNPFDEMPSDGQMGDITPEAEMTFEADMMIDPEMTAETDTMIDPVITPEVETTPVSENIRQVKP